MAVLFRGERHLRIVEVQQAKAIDAEGVLKARPDAIVVAGEIVSSAKDVRGVEADADAPSQRRRNLREEKRHLLERRSNDRPLTGRELHQQSGRPLLLLQRLRDAVGVTVDAARAIIHEVAGMRDARIKPERLAPAQLGGKALDRPRAQHGIGRRKVDQIAVVGIGELNAARFYK